MNGLELDFNKLKLAEYLSHIFNTKAKLISIEKLGEGMLGRTYKIQFTLARKHKYETRSAVMKILKPVFGQELLGERALKLITAHQGYNKLPRHVKSIDVAAILKNERLSSLRDAYDFVLFMEEGKGTRYSDDIQKIASQGHLEEEDKRKLLTIVNYLASIHSTKGREPIMYSHRIRKLFYSSEGIAGMFDRYPQSIYSHYKQNIIQIEKKLVGWRQILRQKCHRLCRTSYNTVYVVRYRSPKCLATLGTSHTPIPLCEMAAKEGGIKNV